MQNDDTVIITPLISTNENDESKSKQPHSHHDTDITNDETVIVSPVETDTKEDIDIEGESEQPHSHHDEDITNDETVIVSPIETDTKEDIDIESESKQPHSHHHDEDITNDETVIVSPVETKDSDNKTSSNTYHYAIQIAVADEYSNLENKKSFIQTLSIGRALDNDITISSGSVSRYHSEIRREHNDWFIFDKGSINGTFINNKPIENGAKLHTPCTLYLGRSGVFLSISSIHDSFSSAKENKTSNNDETILDPKINLSLDKKNNRENFKKNGGEEIKVAWKYKRNMWFVVLLLCFTIGIIGYQQTVIVDNEKNRFYEIKALEVAVSQSEIRLRQENTDILRQDIYRQRENLQKMQLAYNARVKELSSLKFVMKKVRSLKRRLRTNKKTSPLSEYERELILRIAQKFGESELELPEDFIIKVHEYIDKWKGPSRRTLEIAIDRLEKNNYKPIIINAMRKENLPVEFLYICLQESKFLAQAVGSPTKSGTAKGAWQFMPETGKIYGLKLGSLVHTRRFDPNDERFDFKKSTNAAARYLKSIYSTEAQASSLLVMAGYNWGHNGVDRRLSAMSGEPKDKNFWKFTKKYKIPKETYDYVFRIFSAAVIGEDPKYFNFSFQSPTTI